MYIPAQRISAPVPPGTSHAAKHTAYIGKGVPAFTVAAPEFNPPNYIALYDKWAAASDLQATIFLHEAFHYAYPTIRNDDRTKPWTNAFAYQGFVSILGGLKTGPAVDNVFPP